MRSVLTTRDFVDAGTLTEADVDTAVEVVLGNPSMDDYVIGNGHVLNLARAVREHGTARRAMLNPSVDKAYRRAAVRRAILVARPVKR